MNLTRSVLSLMLGCGSLASLSWAQDSPRTCEAAQVASASGLVTIEVERDLFPPDTRAPLAPGDRFDLFRWRTVSARGAGFVARGDGLIVSASSLAGLDSGHHIMVSLPDGRRLEAQLLERDRELALLQIEADGLVTVPLAGSSRLEPGAAITVGSASGSLACFTAVQEGQGGTLMVWVARSACFSPGTPLISSDGAVVGVGTARGELSLPFIGPCFDVVSAVPVERVRALIERGGRLDWLERWFPPQ